MAAKASWHRNRALSRRHRRHRRKKISASRRRKKIRLSRGLAEFFSGFSRRKKVRLAENRISLKHVYSDLEWI